MKKVLFCLTILSIATNLVGCASSDYQKRCYRSNCENRPLYWHELGD